MPIHLGHLVLVFVIIDSPEPFDNDVGAHFSDVIDEQAVEGGHGYRRAVYLPEHFLTLRGGEERFFGRVVDDRHDHAIECRDDALDA